MVDVLETATFLQAGGLWAETSAVRRPQVRISDIAATSLSLDHQKIWGTHRLICAKLMSLSIRTITRSGTLP